MTFLAQHLPFGGSQSANTAENSPASVSLPPPGSHLILSDTLNSPAHFVLFHLVTAAIQLREKVVWVDFRSEGRSSWESALKRLGTTIPPSFVHITPTLLPPGPEPASTSLADESGSLTLDGTYASLQSHLSGSIVILDGLSELVWMGFRPEDVSAFVRGVLGGCVQSDSSLISTIHADSLPLDPLSSSHPTPPVPPLEGPDVQLLYQLVRIGGGGWWRVSNLASGRSGDVHGEITAHPLFSASGNLHPDYPFVPPSQPLQYRLEANTVKVFPKGTGRGFL